MASADGVRQAGVIAGRLDHLIRTVHPAGRGPYTLREIAAAVNAEAGTTLISAAYISQLRTGQRAEPSHSRLAALARFFGVNVGYFSGEAAEEPGQAALMVALRDTGVRSVAIRVAGLSEPSLAAIRAVIENARRLEGLPDDDGDALLGRWPWLPVEVDFRQVQPSEGAGGAGEAHRVVAAFPVESAAFPLFRCECHLAVDGAAWLIHEEHLAAYELRDHQGSPMPGACSTVAGATETQATASMARIPAAARWITARRPGMPSARSAARRSSSAVAPRAGR